MTVILLRSARSGDTEGLTWVSGTDKIDGSKPTQSLCVKFTNVREDRHSWPMPGEHSLAVFVALAETNGAHPGSFESEAEPANT
jgi:hypothetical protein